MIVKQDKKVARQARHARVRTKVSGTAECPRLNEKVLGKPYTNRYGNNSPTHKRGDHHIISCSLVI